jgi:hypothetical protein
VKNLRHRLLQRCLHRHHTHDEYRKRALIALPARLRGDARPAFDPESERSAAPRCADRATRYESPSSPFYDRERNG